MSRWSSLEPGDWVRTTRTVPLTLTDRLLGDGGLPRGTRGVVIARRGGRLDVELDVGWGITRATVKTRDVRAVRRGGGVGEFRARRSRLATARFAVAVALTLPLAHFTILYWWTYRSFDGFVPALVTAALYSAEDSFVAALHQPVKAILYFAVVALLGRFAFGRRAK